MILELSLHKCFIYWFIQEFIKNYKTKVRVRLGVPFFLSFKL